MSTVLDGLRKVKISKQGITDYETNGYFHEWGKFEYHHENSSFHVTRAVIELENGEVAIVRPEYLKFVDSF